MLDDNARKFVTEPIPSDFFEGLRVKSFTLAVDWLEADEDYETKLARKTFDDGTVQILLIRKQTTDEGRKTTKEPLDEGRYRELLTQSILHLKKHRRELTYEQGGVSFEIKYDVFTDGRLHMLEVDAFSDEDRTNFVPEDFPAELQEVTGDISYYGYRVCGILQARES